MIDVKLHDIGEGMTEGEVIHLFVKEGDVVKVDEPLVEVQTDKMTAELPSPAAGTIKKILCETGDIINVGETMILLGNPGEEGEAEAASAVEAPEKPDVDAEGESNTSNRLNDLETTSVEVDIKGPTRILAAPHTRKLARELGVDLSLVKGTGRIGRITDEDIERHMSGENESGAVIEEASGMNRIQTGRKYEAGKVHEWPFRGRRKAIADKMSQSLFTIPHVTHFDEADVTDLIALKDKLKQLDPNKEKGYQISVATYFIKAIALALKAHPIFNAHLDEEQGVIRASEDVHIGIATDAEDGLIVPVIKHADKKSLLEINSEMKDYIKRAKTGKLKPSEIKGSTFTISNVGPLGSTGATPIINYPEVGLMAFHKTKRMPVVDDQDQIIIRSMMNISMSFDHRVTDGASAVAFTNRIIETIEHPEIMLVHLN